MSIMSCLVDGCERKVYARGWCSMHYKRWFKWGDPTRVGRPMGTQSSGADNPSWKGARVGYVAAHTRVRTISGKASSLLCVHCRLPAAQWAYTHLDPDELREVRNGYEVAYSAKPEMYIPLCVPCHKKFDQKESNHA